MSRDDAMSWAAEARRVRHGVRDDLASGAVAIEDLLARVERDDLVAAVRLGWVLESLPGARKVDTRRRLGALGLDPAAPLGALDAADRRTVLAEFAGPGDSGGVAADEPTQGVARQVPPLPAGSSVIVIAGPGGVGKGTLVAELLARDDRLWLSRSWTTRDRRPGEAADAYRFATEAEFVERAAADGFLEWARFLDYRQGSPVPDPPDGADVVFEIDVRGAANVKRLYPEALLIFVDAPDRATQEERLRGRGDAEDRILQRLRKADEELDAASGMDFVHVVNDDLDRTVDELLQIVRAHRSRPTGGHC